MELLYLEGISGELLGDDVVALALDAIEGGRLAHRLDAHGAEDGVAGRAQVL